MKVLVMGADATNGGSRLGRCSLERIKTTKRFKEEFPETGFYTAANRDPDSPYMKMELGRMTVVGLGLEGVAAAFLPGAEHHDSHSELRTFLGYLREVGDRGPFGVIGGSYSKFRLWLLVLLIGGPVRALQMQFIPVDERKVDAFVVLEEIAKTVAIFMPYKLKRRARWLWQKTAAPVLRIVARA